MCIKKYMHSRNHAATLAGTSTRAQAGRQRQTDTHTHARVQPANAEPSTARRNARGFSFPFACTRRLRRVNQSRAAGKTRFKLSYIITRGGTDQRSPLPVRRTPTSALYYARTLSRSHSSVNSASIRKDPSWRVQARVRTVK